MKKVDLISSTFWLVFSLVVVRESYLLGIGTLRSPQAGFLPFVASIALGTLSLIHLIFTLRLKTKTSENTEDLVFNRLTWPKVLYVAISLFIYAILLNTLGFILNTMLLIGFLLIIVERQRWYVVITGTILPPLIGYLIFDVCLKVQMPKGFLGF